MADKDHLHILWTNADVTTSTLMVMMYTKNALKNHWWEKVTVVAWGATAKLLATNQTIQEEYRQAREAGVVFTGCIACANELDVVNELEKLGIELYKWGPPLTELIKEKSPLLSV